MIMARSTTTGVLLTSLFLLVLDVIVPVGGNTVIICCREDKFFIIKVWPPYLDNVENNFVTLSRQTIMTTSLNYGNKFVLSRDNTMIAILGRWRDGMIVWSIGNKYKSLTLKAEFHRKIHFSSR